MQILLYDTVRLNAQVQLKSTILMITHTSTDFLSHSKFAPWNNQVFYAERYIAEGVSLSRQNIFRETETVINVLYYLFWKLEMSSLLSIISVYLLCLIKFPSLPASRLIWDKVVCKSLFVACDEFGPRFDPMVASKSIVVHGVIQNIHQMIYSEDPESFAF
jgi:hypothetical protein